VVDVLSGDGDIAAGVVELDVEFALSSERISQVILSPF
jgi:hypothetical protein